MHNSPEQRLKAKAGHKTTIHTSLLELVRVLNELTCDDNLVIAAARHLLTSSRVTAARSLRTGKITAIQYEDLQRKLSRRRARAGYSGCGNI
jgi:hypothetical protein